MTANIVNSLLDLDRKQAVGLNVGVDTTVPVRVSQFAYTPENRLRVELTPLRGGNARYQARSTYEDGEWRPVELRRHDRVAADAATAGWERVGTVSRVDPRDGAYPDTAYETGDRG